MKSWRREWIHVSAPTVHAWTLSLHSDAVTSLSTGYQCILFLSLHKPIHCDVSLQIPRKPGARSSSQMEISGLNLCLASWFVWRKQSPVCSAVCIWMSWWTGVWFQAACIGKDLITWCMWRSGEHKPASLTITDKRLVVTSEFSFNTPHSVQFVCSLLERYIRDLL